MENKTKMKNTKIGITSAIRFDYSTRALTGRTEPDASLIKTNSTTASVAQAKCRTNQ